MDPTVLLDQIEPGFYAVTDPDHPDTVIYWRRVKTRKTDALNAWPAKAWHGPAIPKRSELPDDPIARTVFVDAWSASRRAYLTLVIVAIHADRAAARRRFADFSICCARCGRPLLDPESKALGIGPDCRRGMDPALLARYAPPLVGQAHAAHLDAKGVDR
ncbi:DUF6011 domain-containing protein [Kitasatospora sp. NPDC058046]|uniref:DUF6011 domain-containing protein n=1 Tax=Kitasatospora sp. NPDC058046 TaxID=3346312 RepID=UPI0036D87151